MHKPSEIAGQAFAWQLCAEIVSGMMANPSRGQYSVKETVSLFDELLREFETYIGLKVAAPGTGTSAGAGHVYREAPQFADTQPQVMRVPQQPSPNGMRPPMPWAPPGQGSQAA